MGCLKCGRNTVSEQVFCPDCLLEIEKYPVRPGTVVQIPIRKSQTAAKKQPKRRTVPLEEQVALLKKRVRILAILLMLVSAIAVSLAFPATEHLMENHFKKGQNYKTVTATTEAN